MILQQYSITSINHINSNLIRIKFYAPEIARLAKPGQFINIKVDETTVPLLRRPFSIHYVEGNEVEIVLGVIGLGTHKLAGKKLGDTLDILGPLGKPFDIIGNENSSVLIGGGLGATPLPLLSNELRKQNRNIITLLGARSKNLLLKDHLLNIHAATDDGSEGYQGNVIDLFEELILKQGEEKIKAYVCGPTAMLLSLDKLKAKYKFSCEVSLETSMACGIGICQGCAVERLNNEKKFSLACIDGPVFDINEIKI